MEKYIHPTDERIKKFIGDLDLYHKTLDEVLHALLRWFDENVTYTRLNAPFYPLQRSDVDVLVMRAGTCGDYSNLIVSVLTALGYQAGYAYVKIDSYGNPQDHICAAVWEEGRWRLVDATLPYRKWNGDDCKHKEYELLDIETFWARMKKEEAYWTEYAMQAGNEKDAGLYYAPWIHEHVIEESEERIVSAFYLLAMGEKRKYQIYVNLLVYTEEKAASPVMCRIQNGREYYRFAVHEAKNIWDSKQYGEEYVNGEIPEMYMMQYCSELVESVRRNVKKIEEALAY